jgi:hypothetical protein
MTSNNEGGIYRVAGAKFNFLGFFWSFGALTIKRTTSFSIQAVKFEFK